MMLIGMDVHVIRRPPLQVMMLVLLLLVHIGDDRRRTARMADAQRVGERIKGSGAGHLPQRFAGDFVPIVWAVFPLGPEFPPSLVYQLGG